MFSKLRIGCALLRMENFLAPRFPGNVAQMFSSCVLAAHSWRLKEFLGRLNFFRLLCIPPGSVTAAQAVHVTGGVLAGIMTMLLCSATEAQP